MTCYRRISYERQFIITCTCIFRNFNRRLCVVVSWQGREISIRKAAFWFWVVNLFLFLRKHYQWMGKILLLKMATTVYEREIRSTAVIKTSVNTATLWRHELCNIARTKAFGGKHFYHGSMSWLCDLEINTENARCREIKLTQNNYLIKQRLVTSRRTHTVV